MMLRHQVSLLFTQLFFSHLALAPLFSKSDAVASIWAMMASRSAIALHHREEHADTACAMHLEPVFLIAGKSILRLAVDRSPAQPPC